MNDFVDELATQAADCQRGVHFSSEHLNSEIILNREETRNDINNSLRLFE